ncbi:MAG TPA: GNAT family N-acetyltransferase [Candidatus Binatia bacterium]|jgi:ribosomal protein S18 acetylase RimI-like enzyme|nr:GNAT family N-acetyltransferase [Candidatus Binatia bacterium]
MVSVEEVVEVQPALVPELQALLQQLSSGTTTLELLTELVEDPGSALFVARRDGLVLGSATLGSFRTAEGLHCRIEDVVVDFSARRQRVGEKLVLACMERARERGAFAVTLNSAPARVAANGLYRKLGFEQRDTNSYVWRP